MSELDSVWQRGLGEWLSGAGPESDIVMSTRVRLARNLADRSFPSRLSEEARRAVADHLRINLEAAELVAGERTYYDLAKAEAVERQCLVERHLISKEHGETGEARGVLLSHDETLSVMVNEEDHLRIQVLRSGFQVDSAWTQIDRFDEALAATMDFAFSTRLGYLTACPTNVGTGLRVSVMLHLPALVLTKAMKGVIETLAKIKLAVRGFYGENTQALGDFFQISNQTTLGRSEAEILAQLAEAVPQIIKHERGKREALIAKNRITFEDRVWRAYGMLERARSMASEEAMDYLSAVRMGVNLSLIDKIPISLVNELFITTQPAHLQLLEGRRLQSSERDERRATVIRAALAGR